MVYVRLCRHCNTTLNIPEPLGKCNTFVAFQTADNVNPPEFVVGDWGLSMSAWLHPWNKLKVSCRDLYGFPMSYLPQKYKYALVLYVRKLSQCGAAMMRSILSQILTKIPHSSSYGVVFCDFKLWSSVPAAAVLHIIQRYNWSSYNGTMVIYLFCVIYVKYTNHVFSIIVHLKQHLQ